MSPDEVAGLLERLTRRIEDSRSSLKSELDAGYEDDPGRTRPILEQLIDTTDRARKLGEAVPLLGGAVAKARSIEALIDQIVRLSTQVEPEVERLRAELSSEEFGIQWDVVRSEMGDPRAAFEPVAASPRVDAVLEAVRALASGPVGVASAAREPERRAGEGDDGLVAEIRRRVQPLDATILGSEGFDPILAIDLPGDGELTLAALLAHLGFLRPIEREAYRERVRAYRGALAGGDDPMLDEWDRHLTALAAGNAELRLLELRNFETTEGQSRDEHVHLVAIQEPDGTWWAVGPRFDPPEALHRDGREPLPTLPGWLVPFTQQKMLMAIGHQTMMSGEDAGDSRRPGRGPLVGGRGESIEHAIDQYLLGSELAHREHFFGFSLRSDLDDLRREATEELEQLLLARLDHPELYILGNRANFNHFVIGRHSGGHAGVRILAVWS